jgi:regulator of protease activity HflC (stomatin/prohibitin superfamily)
MLLNQAIFVVALAVWILLFGVIAIILVRTAQAQGLQVALSRVFSERLVVLLLIVAIVVTLVTNGIIFIQPQEVGIVSSLISPRGYRPDPLDSGLHVIVPLVERVHRYPRYLQTYTISSVADNAPRGQSGTISARTSDGQVVYVEVSVIYAIDAAQAVRVYLDWQDRYEADLVSPLVRGVVRAKVSQFAVDEVNSDRRQELENNIAADLSKEMNGYGFQVKRFLLRNIAFSPEYAAAVEQKQVAFQEVTRDQYKALQIEILSRAQASALDRLGVALAKNPDVATLSYIEKLAPSITTLLVPNTSPFILPLPTAFSRQNAVPAVTATPTPIGGVAPTPTGIIVLPTFQPPQTIAPPQTPVPVITPTPLP